MYFCNKYLIQNIEHYGEHLNHNLENNKILGQ